MDPPIPLAKVDATEETELGTRFEVTSYPTMKIFRKGKPYEYKGARDEYGEWSWVWNSEFSLVDSGNGTMQKIYLSSLVWGFMAL